MLQSTLAPSATYEPASHQLGIGLEYPKDLSNKKSSGNHLAKLDLQATLADDLAGSAQGVEDGHFSSLGAWPNSHSQWTVERGHGGSRVQHADLVAHDKSLPAAFHLRVALVPGCRMGTLVEGAHVDSVGYVEILDLWESEFDMQVVDWMGAFVKHREIHVQRFLFVIVVILGLCNQVLCRLHDVGRISIVVLRASACLARLTSCSTVTPSSP